MKFGTIMVAALAIGSLAVSLTASAEDEAPAAKTVKKRQFKDRQEFAGTIVCLGCELEERGAHAQCTLHAKHAQGLLAEDGTLWTFIDNTRGHHLIKHKKLLGKPIKVVGWKYPKTQYIEAWSYYVNKGDKWVHWDYCKICGFEPGEFKGTDLCPGCVEDGEDEAEDK